MMKRQTYAVLAILAMLLSARAEWSADGKSIAPIHQATLTNTTTRITAPLVLTNSVLLGLSESNAVARLKPKSIHRKPDGSLRIFTGIIDFPHMSDYVWERIMIVEFTNNVVSRVTVLDEPGACVEMAEPEP